MVQVLQMAGVGSTLGIPILTTPSADEARLAIVKLSQQPSPPKYTSEFMRCVTIIDRLDALKMLLEPLTLSEPKDPSWAVVLEVRGRLSKDCEDVDLSLDSDNSGSFENKKEDVLITGRSKVSDILEEDEEGGVL